MPLKPRCHGGSEHDRRSNQTDTYQLLMTSLLRLICGAASLL
jgi:hypothetical protein